MPLRGVNFARRLGVSIESRLTLYLRHERDLRLDDADATLVALTGYLQSACANLTAGGAVMGEDTGDKYDDLAFALPANAGATYCERKRVVATARLGAAAQVWEAP